ncbi:receptor kinase-like protein Xa21 [Papaver somniferum]|uniref:receptor kinase-like protein Xa21 n=1 Tax=Papaver somniferum TaxID=3469 RepID=UPI000E702A6B|nr:receptor kinase-like protein Xa21 [Papaver somniferum]
MKILPQQQPSLKYFSIELLFGCMFVMDVHCLVVDDYRSTDRSALLSFKDGITEDPLGVLSTWNEKNDSLHFCQWKGVTCSRRHPNRVTKLALNSQRMVGSISPHIGNLSFLADFDLNSNNLHGKIPPQIGRLSRLKHLNLSYNSLEGEIPENISRCSNLIHFDITRNKLVGNVPNEIGYLLNLKMLMLAENYLSGEIPASLGSIPSGIGNLQNLGILYLGENKFSGSIPSSFGNLTQLIDLSLHNNSLTGLIPSSIGYCTYLEILELQANQLSGSIPKQVFQLPSFPKFLSLAMNSFTGSLPAEVGNLKHLGVFDMSENKLSGEIPATIGECSSLTYLNLQEGEVPREGVFKNTSAFSIEGNSKLCGGIPDLKLPNCSIPLNPNAAAKQRKPMRNKVLIIIIVTAVLILIVFLLTLYWRNRSKSMLTSTPLDVDNRLMGVSYNELLKATNGFNDSTNLLGEGSFGSVYKGLLQQDESKPIAVKVLHLQQRGATKSFMAEFFELMANGSLENWLHPTISDVNNDDQLQEKNLNLERRLSIAVDVAFALNYLHRDSQSPIVHCDVKPSNVLLDDDLTAHVGDFGLAKFLINSSSNSRKLNQEDASSVAIKGSIGYVSPEYGMGGEVSTQGDVYSYGILLLEMFIGKRPTDYMFRDGLSIHDFSKMHELPEHIEEVIDSRLLMELREDHNDAEITNYSILRNEKRSIDRDTMRQILASIIQIGVKCSPVLPSDRCSMNEVVVDVQAVKNQFLGVGL